MPSLVTPEHDVVIIGAGFGGLAALYNHMKADSDVVLWEAGGGVGGTWWWNTYPGARVDTEAWYYAYSFEPEILNEFRWTQRFPDQKEVFAYLDFVADRLGLKSRIQFNTRVQSLTYDEDNNLWHLVATDGRTTTSRFVVTAVGGLSEPHLPDIPGIDTYEGIVVHSARWTEGLDVTGKRVGIVGTGASGIQLVEELARQAGDLFVLQRTPNFVLDRNNYEISDEQWEQIKANYPAIWDKARAHYFGFPLELTMRTVRDTTPEERERIFEKEWAHGGFSFYLETFDDLAFDEWSNEQAAEFIRNKIRERVKDPEVAELLCPKTHVFGAKRCPIGHEYYEQFNRPNVHLIDVRERPITEITKTGVTYGDQTVDLDVLIFATGFDALTGGLTAMDITGRDGAKLADVFAGGIRTHLGLATHRFPNLLYSYGPQTPYANIPPAVERAGQFQASMLNYMASNGYDYVEAEPEPELQWRDELKAAVDGTIFYKHGITDNAWMLGNNIPGKPVEINVYFGGFDQYLAKVDQVQADGFAGFTFKRVSVPDPEPVGSTAV